MKNMHHWVIAVCLSVTGSSVWADISYLSQNDAVRVQGLAYASDGGPLEQFNNFDSAGVLLAPVAYNFLGSATSLGNSVTSASALTVNAQAYGTVGLHLTGNVSAFTSNALVQSGSTFCVAESNYDLGFSLDALTDVIFRVWVTSSDAAGRIGLDANPNSIGWGGAPGAYEFIDTLWPGQYNFNVNVDMIAGANSQRQAQASFELIVGQVPTPSTMAISGVLSVFVLGRRRA